MTQTSAHMHALSLDDNGLPVITTERLRLRAPKADDTPLAIVGPWTPGDWPETEVGWSVIDPATEGTGIATEAAQAALGYAYHGLGWTTAMSAINAGNDRSAALAERLGATCESTFEHPTFGPLNIWRHRGPDAYPAPTYGDQDD